MPLGGDWRIYASQHRKNQPACFEACGEICGEQFRMGEIVAEEFEGYWIAGEGVGNFLGADDFDDVVTVATIGDVEIARTDAIGPQPIDAADFK